MQSVNIHQAKTNLSKYLKDIQQGEEIIICNNGTPVAIIKPYVTMSGQRKLGSWKGKVKISDDFDNLPDAFKEYFE